MLCRLTLSGEFKERGLRQPGGSLSDSIKRGQISAQRAAAAARWVDKEVSSDKLPANHFTVRGSPRSPLVDAGKVV